MIDNNPNSAEKVNNTEFLPSIVAALASIKNEDGSNIPIEDIQKDSVIVPFGAPDQVVELHIFNPIDELLESIYSIPYSNIKGIVSSTSLDLNNIKLDLHQIFRDWGYVAGKFKFQLNFHQRVLGTHEDPAIISNIAVDRLEISLKYNGISNLESSPLTDKFGNRLEYFLNLGDNKLFRVARFSKDYTLSSATSNVYLITLQSPLPDEIGLGTNLWVDLQSADPQLDSIVIFPRIPQENVIPLRGPNFSITTNSGFAQSTAFKSWNDILGTNPTSSQQLINKFISSSFDSIEIPIDYRVYDNFVYYGSAEDRLENFRYKIKLIEYYDALIEESNTISNPSVLANRTDLSTKRNTLLAGFDGYEKYLYYESSSYETSSYGEFNPSTWPKNNSSLPYTLYSYTSSEASTWYTSQLASASLYDNNNEYALVRLIPEHILLDGFNDKYTTFVNMIGQHFDILWSYVKHITSTSNRQESLSSGLAKDLVYHVLQSMGIDSANGFNIEELWLDALGVDANNAYTQTGSLHSISNSDISKETWKRILNNLPYLLKTKGTNRGIRALMNCYGVPDSVYRIKEYSGPYQYSSNVVSLDQQYRKLDKFTYSTEFTGSNSISVDLVNINSLQFRFKTTYSAIVTQSLMSNTIAVVLYRSASDSDYGYLKVDAQAPVLGPFYNGRWNNVTITNGDVYIFQSIDGRLIGYSGSASTTIDGTYIFGEGAATDFSGSMQEIRAWDTNLALETLYVHAKNPQSIVGNNFQFQGLGSSYYDNSYNGLMYRYPLGSTLQIYTGSSVTIPSIHPNQSLPQTATAVNFTTSSYLGNEEDYYIWYPNLGENLDISDKIRIEGSSIAGQLSSKHSIEKNQYDTYALDSPKLGVFFSPQDEINEDIANQFSGMLLDNILGDCRDDSKEYYPALQELRAHYNLKYTDRNSFWKYLRLVENFDASMFYLIKKFLPARSVKMVGLVIQPTLLERSKIPQREAYAQTDSYSGECTQGPTELIGNYVTYESEAITIKRNLDSDYLVYQATGELENITSLDGVVSSHTGTIAMDVSQISSNVIYVNENTAERFIPQGRQNHMYSGCKITSRGVNVPSDDTFDGSPVITVWNRSPNTPVNVRTAAGQISTLPSIQGGRNPGAEPR